MNIAAVYLFARDREDNYSTGCATAFSIGMVPFAELAIFTMGFGLLGAIPVACVGGGLGAQALRYRALKTRAKEALISLDNKSFTALKQALCKGDLPRIGSQEIEIKKANQQALMLHNDRDNVPRYDSTYEGLKYFLQQRGYDTSNALVY